MLASFKKTPTQSGQPELIQKLVQLAHGDVELVNRAIRSAVGPDGSADLGKIVEHIKKNRRQDVPQQVDA